MTTPSPVAERFAAKVRKSAECWEWQGYCNPYGYGSFNLNGKMQYAHRVAWELANGTVPDGLCVLHSCDNPPCVRPSHLFLGTLTDNSRDMVQKGRCRGAENAGEGNGRAKLTTGSVRLIRAMYASGHYVHSELASIFGICKTHASDITNHKYWRHLT